MMPKTLRKFFLLHSVYNLGLGFFMSFNIMFLLQEKHIDFMGIGVLDIVSLVTVLLLEIPTGIIADKYSRRLSFQLSVVARIGFFILLIIATKYEFLLISFVILALSDSLFSGAYQAWLYDEVLGHLTDLSIKTKLATFRLVEGVSATIGGGLGALLYFNFQSPLGLMVPCMLFLISLATSFFIEENFNRDTFSSYRLFEYTKERYRDLLSDFGSGKSLPGLLLFFSLQAFVISGIDNYWQPVVSGKLKDLAILPMAWVLIRLGSVLGPILARFLVTKKTRSVVLFAVMSSSICLALFPIFNGTSISILLFAFHAIFFSSLQPVLSYTINRQLSASGRAFSLSCFSLFESLAGSLGILAGAFLATHFEFGFLFGTMAGVFALNGILLTRNKLLP